MISRKYFVINDWFFLNKPLYEIRLGENLDSAIKKIGKGSNLFKNGHRGYYYKSNGYRFGFDEKNVDEIGIELHKTKKQILLYDRKGKINLSKAKVHKVLDFLNERFILWRVIEHGDSSRLTIQIVDCEIWLTFYLYKGTLEYISQVSPLI